MKTARKSGSTKNDDDKPPDPELTRSGLPELTRCDHCGVLDAHTQPTMVFAQHPGDGWHWLHPRCTQEFVAIIYEQIRHVTRVVGSFIQYPDGQTEELRYHRRPMHVTAPPPPAPNPPPGWLRSRCRR